MSRHLPACLGSSQYPSCQVWRCCSHPLRGTGFCLGSHGCGDWMRLMWSGPPRGVQTCPNTPSILWGILERFTQRDAEWYVEICPPHFALNILNLLLQLLLYQGDVPSNLHTSYMFLLFLANTICPIEPMQVMLQDIKDSKRINSVLLQKE